MTKFFNKTFLISSLIVALFVSLALFLPSNVSATTVGLKVVGGGCDPNSQSLTVNDFPACTSINIDELGFKIPSLGDLLTFVIRAFFVIAGLAALFYMLLGAFAWVMSGGDSEAVTAAQQKIQAAVVGMLIIVGVLAIIWTMEQVIFNRRICLGLSCPLTLPGLIEPNDSAFCCACIQPDGSLGAAVDVNTYTCNPDGTGTSKN